MSLLLKLTALLVTTTLLAAACGDDADTETSSDPGSGDDDTTIVDREFWSTGGTVGGEPLDLVEGTRIRLSFGPTEFGASAGCNQLGGGYTLDGDTIVVGDMYMTEMGCEPALHAQDDFVVAFLTGGPTHELDGDTLLLTSPDGDTIELLDKKVAEPDVDLTATTWTITGFFDELAAWSYGTDEPAALTFADDGTGDGSDGCGRFTLTHDVGDDTITIDPGGWPSCDGASMSTQEFARDMRRVLSGGQLVVEIDGRNLRLTAPDGIGMTATAAG